VLWFSWLCLGYGFSGDEIAGCRNPASDGGENAGGSLLPRIAATIEAGIIAGGCDDFLVHGLWG